jgi:ADP-ribosylglycohydrolase
MKSIQCLLMLAVSLAWQTHSCGGESESTTIRMSAEQLRDKIRGGLLGQMLGNLNGLKHEMKYIENPGNVTGYVPGLPAGARTDDDTDFEWVYLVEMQRRNTILLSPDQIARLWRERINRRIWCSNQYARQLMDIGLKPPMTGRFALNPWADFNISGQFLCESFALMAPAMPQTAGRVALNYTTVTIDLEPAQTTQLFTAMIATAFVHHDVDRLIDAGVAALDRRSRLHEIVADVRRWHARHADDWRTTRRLLKEKYSQANGTMRDRNGYELNTASTIAALLYGRGDFVQTLLTAFNFGWDADNTAATAGTIIGVTKGYRWMMSQGWQIVDRYENTTREKMPHDETITSFADRLVDLAEKMILENGGKRDFSAGQPFYHIRAESPCCVMPLPGLDEQVADMRRRLRGEIEDGVLRRADAKQKARAAYLAICLDLGEDLRRQDPQCWSESIRALAGYRKVVQAIYYHADVPAGESLRRRAQSAGLRKPDAREPLW